MRRPVRVLIVGGMFTAFALLIGACSTLMDREWMIRWDQDLKNVQGKTFTVYPLRSRAGEPVPPGFTGFAQAVAQRLVQHGMIYQEKADRGKTDFRVTLDYRVTEGQQMAQSAEASSHHGVGPPMPMGPPGRSLPVPSGTAPYPAGVGPISGAVTTNNSYAVPTYSKMVQIQISEGRPGDGRMVRRYEASAFARDPEQDPTRFVPQAIEILLKDFPGESKGTKTVFQQK